MIQPTTAETWHAAMKRARTLHPTTIRLHIAAGADTGLRATRYDTDGGRTARVPCKDHERCEDGPQEHSHHVTNDPTGNAAVRGSKTDQAHYDELELRRAEKAFIEAAGIVLDWVCGKRPETWVDVWQVNQRLMPGSIQAGLDVDERGHLYEPILRVERAVATVAGIARDHMPRTPSTDEQNWTAGLADEDCCAWHLAIHRRYRRPRAGGTNCCADCLALAELLGQKPPQWLLEAEMDLAGKPKAWRAALSRCMDELGIVREAG